MKLDKNTIIFDNEIELSSFESYIKKHDIFNIRDYVKDIYNITYKDLKQLLDNEIDLTNQFNKASYHEKGILLNKLKQIEYKIDSIRIGIGFNLFEAFKHNAFINKELSNYQIDYYQDLSDDSLRVVFYPAYGSNIKTTQNKTFYQKVENFYNYLLTVL